MAGARRPQGARPERRRAIRPRRPRPRRRPQGDRRRPPPVGPILAAKRAEEPDPSDEAEAPEPSAAEDERTEPGGDRTGRLPSPAAAGRRPRSGGPIANARGRAPADRRGRSVPQEERAGEPGPVPGRPGLENGRTLRGRPTPRRPRPRRARAASRSASSPPTGRGRNCSKAPSKSSRPEGRAWLDPHRYAILAMEGSSGEADRSAAAIRGPRLPPDGAGRLPVAGRGGASDGTPTAGVETRIWLSESILPTPAPELAYEPVAVTPAQNGEAEVDIMDQAVAAVRRPGRGGAGADPPRDEGGPVGPRTGSSASSRWPSCA